MPGKDIRKFSFMLPPDGIVRFQEKPVVVKQPLYHPDSFIFVKGNILYEFFQAQAFIADNIPYLFHCKVQLITAQSEVFFFHTYITMSAWPGICFPEISNQVLAAAPVVLVSIIKHALHAFFKEFFPILIISF